MGYAKMITYGKVVELYTYEKDLQYTGRVRRQVPRHATGTSVAAGRDSVQRQEEPVKAKRPDNARRAALAFTRIVTANFGESDHPILASFTYRENQTEIEQGYKDWKSFIDNARSRFGSDFRYVCVPEFQKRGALHFHALFWGIPPEVAREERSTRVVANMWSHGFVDLIGTDGNKKLSGYLAKYMAKSFLDPRFARKKAYRTSRNVKRPIIEKGILVSPYFLGDLQITPDLSTVEPSKDVTFDTQWMGRGRFRLFNL